jgi:transcriptional antiterminator RfaH
MPYWSVARTEPNRDAFAAASAMALGFTVFAPRVLTRAKRVAPLFPSYLFVQIVDQWRLLERTMGFSHMVRFGDAPSRVPDAQIESLKSRIHDGFVTLPPPPSARRAFKKGEPVRIVAGPFEGLNAIHSGMSTRAREIVLLEMLGGQRQVAIDRALVLPRQSPPAPARRFGGKLAAWEVA